MKKKLKLHVSDLSETLAASFMLGLGHTHTDWSSTVSREIDPSLYQSAPDFVRDYWSVESFSKMPVDIGINREKVALTRFHEADGDCRLANARLTDFFARAWPSAVHRRQVATARRLLHRLLSGITLDELVDSSRWGPGASTGLSRRRSSAQHKWAFSSHISYSAVPYYLALRKWSSQPLQAATIVEGNKVTLVPKNARTDRVIAIEPDWNMFFQLGLGKSIRRRLNRVGLLLPSAQETNRQLARQGSANGSLATLDLKSASDSVSLALCELLLPSDLNAHLLRLRSEKGDVKGVPIIYEKISSMGNGTTFELETAIFWALARAVSPDGIVAVYGDDIILPSNRAEDLTSLLEVLGFSVNPKKSFSTGLFRESCGGHYFNGADVSPPYFRKPLDFLPTVISAANAIRSRSRSVSDLLWHDVKPSWDRLHEVVPSYLRGPASVGDVCLHTEFDEAVPRWSLSRQCFSGKGLFKRRKSEDAPVLGGLISALWSGSEGELNLFPGEEEVVYVGRWYAYTF